jgi:hypothetical protein
VAGQQQLSGHFLAVAFQVRKMKSPLIAALAVVLFFFAACGKKSTEITSSTSSPPLNPRYVAEDPSNDSIESPSSVVDQSPQEQAIPSPSPSASTGRPVFKSEAATQVANQYLNSYQTLITDLNAKQPSPTSPEASLNDALTAARKIARDASELTNQNKQVQSQLTAEEKKRLRQYQKSLEQTGQDP